MKSDQIVRRAFMALTVLFIVFIMVASWTPTSGGLGGERKGFLGVEQPDGSFRPHNARDIATNVLLYIPLGVFLALAVTRRRPRFVSPWLFFGLGVSLVMEVGQMFIGRQPDIIDLITNSSGYAIGFGVIVMAMRSYGLDSTVLLGIHADDEQNAKTRTIAAFRFVYVSIYALVALLPFDVSVSLSDVYAQLFPDENGRVKLILDPFYHLSRWQDDGLKLTLEFLGLVPVAALTALLSIARGKLNAFNGVFVCIVLATLCELAQVFLMSRTTDIAMLPMAAIAGVAGWGLARAWFNIQNVQIAADEEGDEGRWKPLAVAIAGYAIILLFLAWSPFRFETDPVTVAKKILYESNLLPFKEHFSTRSLGSALDIVKEVGLFVPLGILVSFLLIDLRPGLPRQHVILLAGVACGAFATFTELSQSVSIGRYMDVTDIFLGGAGGIAGAVLLRLFHVRRTPPRRAGSFR